MGDELVGENRGVGFDFDEIDGHGGNFGEDDTAEGVCKGEVYVAEDEYDGQVVCLWRLVRVEMSNTTIRGASNRSYGAGRAGVGAIQYHIVIHDCEEGVSCAQDELLCMVRQ
jgi:hypothetical protein